MKAVTEFPGYLLTKALQSKTSLVAEGKTPEEIQTSLGTTFKYEGEKLTFFVNALEIAGKQSATLKRVLVIRLNEGETNAPVGGTKIEELYYVPEILNLTTAKPLEKQDPRGGKRGGKGKGGPKESPWGLSPEEKAAKNAKAANKAGGTPVKPS